MILSSLTKNIPQIPDLVNTLLRAGDGEVTTKAADSLSAIPASETKDEELLAEYLNLEEAQQTILASCWTVSSQGVQDRIFLRFLEQANNPDAFLLSKTRLSDEQIAALENVFYKGDLLIKKLVLFALYRSPSVTSQGLIMSALNESNADLKLTALRCLLVQVSKSCHVPEALLPKVNETAQNNSDASLKQLAVRILAIHANAAQSESLH